MKVLLSYSGSQSMGVAEALRKLIKIALPDAKPWMAFQDIQPGSRWQEDLYHTLRETRFAVICLTRENRLSPWLLFEAGAIASKPESSNKKVYPLSIDFELDDLPGPLKQFQGVKCDRAGITKILHDLNEAMGFKESLLNLEDKISTHWEDFINQISGGWISWDTYWEKQSIVIQLLQNVSNDRKYVPDLLVGISNGGLHFADTVLRRVYENTKPLVALWANRQKKDDYFDNALNNTFFEGDFLKKLSSANFDAGRDFEILILDDVVGTTTTFNQIMRYLESKLAPLVKNYCIRFMFLYTKKDELPELLLQHLLTEDKRCKQFFLEAHFDHKTKMSKLPYLKDISTGGVITKR
jgi:hypoxanthine phosphoribosyltransferase